eukprot:3304482-Amphidinium_carterae.1
MALLVVMIYPCSLNWHKAPGVLVQHCMRSISIVCVINNTDFAEKVPALRKNCPPDQRKAIV